MPYNSLKMEGLGCKILEIILLVIYYIVQGILRDIMLITDSTKLLYGTESCWTE